MKTHQHKVNIATGKRLLYVALFHGLVFLIGTLFSISVTAQASQKLSFQGYLEDSDETPLQGNHQLTFTMYMSESGTRPLWQETQTNVTFDKGVFSVILGNEIEMFVDFESEVWLGVQLENEAEFSPRSRITSVPHAFSSDYSHGMYGYGNVMPGDGKVGIGTIDPKESLEVVGTVKATKFVGDGSGLTNINVGTSLWNKSGENINYTSGRVGIMNDDPEYGLDVTGNVRARSDLIAGSSSKNGSLFIRNISNNDAILLRSNGDSYLKGGNVGIMNDDPEYGLDVTGNVRARSDLIAGSSAKDGSLFIRNISNNNAILLRSNGDSYLKGGNVGINTTSPDYQLDVNGVIRGTNVSASDQRWKKNIRQINGALTIISEIRGVRYDWKVEEYEEMNFSHDPQIGLIAQEVQKVLPELIFTGANGYKSVNYTQLTAVLIEAIKEQQVLILSMQEQMESIVDSFARLEKKPGSSILVDSSNSIK